MFGWLKALCNTAVELVVRSWRCLSDSRMGIQAGKKHGISQLRTFASHVDAHVELSLLQQRT